MGQIFGRTHLVLVCTITRKSEFPPEVAHLLCVVEIVVWCARQAVEVAYPPETTIVMLTTLRVIFKEGILWESVCLWFTIRKDANWPAQLKKIAS